MSSILYHPCSGCARILGSSKRLPASPTLPTDISWRPATSFNSKKPGYLRNIKPKETVALFRTSVQNFSKSEWKWSIDVNSLIRTVGSLNLELPKSWNTFLPTITRIASKETDTNFQKKVSCDNKKTEKLHDDKAAAQNCTSSEESKHEENQKDDIPSSIVDRTEIIRKHRSRLYDEEDVPVIREQHDFSTAMSSLDESIRSYNMARKRTSGHKTTENRSNIKEPAAQLSSNTSSSSVSSVMSKAEQTITEAWKKFTPTRNTETAESGVEIKKPPIVRRKNAMARASINRKTRELVMALKMAGTNASKLIRLEDLCSHLAEYPESTAVATKEHLLSVLLRMRRLKDKVLQEQVREALCLIGYIDPVKGRGIRLLSMDGGGTRGLSTLETLKRLQELTGKQPYELFDYIMGVSTGGLLAIMLGVFRVPIHECTELYKDFSREMFTTSRLEGARKLVTSYAYYDTQMWEKILQDQFGFKTFLESSRDAKCPKIANVSTIMNRASIRNFLFRNYNLPPRVFSVYPGSPHHCLWEGIRASSAAPMYYEEFMVGNNVHQDGGLLTNNPTAIALHECKLLWPESDFQCIVSLGTGRFEPEVYQQDPSYTSLKTKLQKFIQSATDTEAVHIVLHDLLPPRTYFRFNPYNSEDFELDEVRPDRWETMKHDTRMYLRKNEHKMKEAASQLMLEKHVHQKAVDWVKLQAKLQFS